LAEAADEQGVAGGGTAAVGEGLAVGGEGEVEEELIQ